MIKKFIFFFCAMLIIFLSAGRPFPFAESADSAQIKIPVEIEEQVKSALRTGKVTLNFEDIEIGVLAKLISEITRKNIVVDERVRGKITIFSAKPVTPRQAWEIFVSAVKAKGFDVVELKTFTKILPLGSKREFKLAKEEISSPEEELVVYIAVLKNADAVELQKSIQPLISSPSGTASAYQPNNSLVIVDTAENITRLVSIIKQMDASAGYKLRVYNPKFIDVNLLADSLEKILKEKSSDIKISSYEPTNSLLAYVPVNKIKSLEGIIKNLDRVEATAEKKMQVYYVQNADAEDIAKVLSTMLKEKEKVEVKKEAEGGKAASSKTKEIFSTTVAADKSTNSLILYVTDEEYKKLKAIIGKLDMPRKQILISAIIAEVSLKKILDVGIKWNVIKDKVAGSFEGGMSQEQLYGVLASGNFVIGAVGQNATTITVGGQQITFPNIFALISLLQTDSDFNLLSAPRVVTLDHKEAKLVVGNVVPYATGIKFDVQNNPIITYDYKNIGLDLKITPHINQSDQIRLDISQKLQEITEFLRPSVGNISYVVPISSERQFETTITVGENQTVVVGGLVSKTTLDSIKKFPILGDLPLIGHIFRKRTKENKKTVLFAFITPHIIDTAEKIKEVTEKFEKAMQEKLPPAKEDFLNVTPRDIDIEPILTPKDVGL